MDDKRIPREVDKRWQELLDLEELTNRINVI